MSVAGLKTPGQYVVLVGGVTAAALLSSFSLETPLSHVMLLSRLRDTSASAASVDDDLEKQDFNSTSASDLVAPGDDLWAATKKLWRVEGWRGFVKGFLPHLVVLALSTASALVLDSLLPKIIDTRRTRAPWRVINLLILGGLKNVATSILVNPAVVLRTRMRLSPASRTTREEVRHLSFRTGLADWFSPRTIGPAVLRYAVFDLLRGFANHIIVPHSSVLGPDGIAVVTDSLTQTNVVQAALRQAVVTLPGSLFAFPFIRCQELAAVTNPPLERPSVPIYGDYRGLGDELVRDSAWYGVTASLQHALFGTLCHVLPSAAIYFLMGR